MHRGSTVGTAAPTHAPTDRPTYIVPKDEELASAAARFHEMMQTTGMMTGWYDVPECRGAPDGWMAGMMGSDFLSDSE